MQFQGNQVHIKKSYLIFFILIVLFGIATPVLADYLGPDRVVTTYEVEAVDYGVWARDNNTAPYCLDKFGNKADDCIVCEWEGSPGNPCGNATYSYKLGTRHEPVEVSTTYPSATINGTLQNCTLQNGWCVTPLQLQMTGNEPVSGYSILLIEGTHNGEIFACEDNPCNYSITHEGTNTFEYWALSSWGDSSTKRTETIKVDTVNPNVNLDVTGTLGLNNWYVSNVVLTAIGQDTISGLLEALLSVDNGTYTPTTTLSDGVYQIEVIAKDNAFNTSTASANIQVDTTTPTLTLSISGTKGNNNFYTSNVTITPNANDATSGVERIEVSINNGARQVITAPITLSDGIHTYQFVVYDKAGNYTETPVQQIKIDTIAPTVDADTEINLGDTLYYTLRDAGSGLWQERIVIEDEDEKYKKIVWLQNISGNKVKGDILWDGKFKDGIVAPIGEYYITFKIPDLAGNETFFTTVIKVNPLSYFQPIPEFIVPENIESNNESTSELDNEESSEQNFGGETTTQSNNESTTQTLSLVTGGSNGSTSSTLPISLILTGVVATAAIAAVMKVVNDAQKKREEEEEQSYQQALAQAEVLNQQEAEKKAQQWLEGQAILNAYITDLEQKGATPEQIAELREQGSTQGLGLAIHNADNLGQSLLAQQMINQQAYDIYRQGEYVGVPIEDENNTAYQTYRDGEYVSVPIEENSWWKPIMPIADFIAGTFYQLVIVNNLNPLVAITPAPENAKHEWFAGWSNEEKDTTAFIAGRIFGGLLGVAQGAWEILSGIATGTGGTIVSCSTGILCIGGGVASITVATALVTHGAVVFTTSAYGIGEQIQALSEKGSQNNNGGGRPGNNYTQNKQFDGAVREIEKKIGRKLTKNEIRQLHDSIHHLENPGYWDIIEEGLNLFGD